MSTFGFAENNLLLTDIVPRMSQLLDSSKPLQTRTSEPAVPPPYPETAYQWLVETLDGLIDFGQRHGHYGVINLSDGEYDWLDDVLEGLIYSVGEDESHPLEPLMRFIIRIIANYEDKYVPKLTERFPELAEEAPIETTNENNNPSPPYASELSDSELAAHAFFAIGCLLWQGGKAEKALSAYDTAIQLKPNYAEVYNNRGNIKSGLGSHDAALSDYDEAIRLNPNFMNAYVNRGIVKLGLNDIDEARSNLQTALELSEQQDNADFKALAEEWLQRLNQMDSKQGNRKQPRRGGQWKGKVKIAEDFNELPESLTEVFRGDNE